MKGKKILILVLVIIILVGAVIGIILKNRGDDEKASKKGELGEITLRTNGGVPNRWEYEIENEEIVKYEKMDSEDLNPENEGGEVVQKYYFEGLKEGETQIIFRYYNIVNNIDDEVKTYNVTVDENLNVNIEDVSE